MSSQSGSSLLRGAVTSGIVATLVVTLVLSGCALTMGARRAESQASDISAATYTPRPTREATRQPTPEPTLPEWVNRPPPDLMLVTGLGSPVRGACRGRLVQHMQHE